jgi:trehalose synthase
MLELVHVGERILDSYRGVVPDAVLDHLRDVSSHLRGLRVLHINATPYGGGVSELLRSVVPLLNNLGLVADWKIIRGNDAFFQATKTIHNGLQGAKTGLSKEQRDTYLANANQNAKLLEERYDFVVIHDPQPAAILSLRGKDAARWIWRCHIDTSHPNPEVMAFLRPYFADYDAAVFTMAQFVPPEFPVDRIGIIPPAIDPLSPKNLPLEEDLARQILDWIGIVLEGPLITQVARFDPWKDPLGVIAAWRLAREEIPGLSLALVGSMALDDPEGWEVYRRIKAEAQNDPGIHVFTNLTGVGNIEVNAFQRLSSVVVQKSIREGFGLVVSEALWKETPVVAGKAGGIPLQMADQVGGFLVDSVEECATAVVRLLRNREEAKTLGRQGRERVREHFLLPRLLLNELSLMLDLLRARPIHRIPEHVAVSHDPVCGMAIGPNATPVTATHKAKQYIFCSEGCRTRFLKSPERFARE